MSSSDSDDFFGDGESESEGKEEGRDKQGGAVPECQEDSPEASSSKDDGTKQVEMSDGEKSDDEGDDDEEDVSSKSVQEEVVEEEDGAGSGEELGVDEPVTHSDRSDELEELFKVPLPGTTPCPAQPQHRRPASARCRVKVVVDAAPGHVSQKGKYYSSETVHGWRL